MRPPGRLARAAIVAVVALALIVLASVTATARSRPSTPAGEAHAPLRAIIYLTADAPGVAGLQQRPAPSVTAGDSGSISRHLAALKWARADAAIMP